VPDRPVEQLTVREMFTGAERLVQEISGHLEHGFVPKSHDLVRLVRPSRGKPYSRHVQDVTVRNQAVQVLDSDNFTGSVYEKLVRYGDAIDKAVLRIINGG